MFLRKKIAFRQLDDGERRNFWWTGLQFGCKDTGSIFRECVWWNLLSVKERKRKEKADDEWWSDVAMLAACRLLAMIQSIHQRGPAYKWASDEPLDRSKRQLIPCNGLINYPIKAQEPLEWYSDLHTHTIAFTFSYPFYLTGTQSLAHWAIRPLCPKRKRENEVQAIKFT